MDLIKSIRNSLITQAKKQKKISLNPTENEICNLNRKSYISYCITWVETSEGFLFWSILNSSYKNLGSYDYLTIIKLFNKYGHDIFALKIKNITPYLYESRVNIINNTLTNQAFTYLCKRIEEIKN